MQTKALNLQSLAVINIVSFYVNHHNCDTCLYMALHVHDEG